MARRVVRSVMALVFGPMMGMACDGSSNTPMPTGPTPPPVGFSPSPAPGGPASNTYPLSGVSDLTLTLGNDCSAVPELERTRAYTASISYTSDGRYVVTLGSGRFLTGPICTGGGGVFAGMGCDQFFASEDIDMANFFLENNNDEAHGGHIVEQLANGDVDRGHRQRHRPVQICGRVGPLVRASPGTARGRHPTRSHARDRRAARPLTLRLSLVRR